MFYVVPAKVQLRRDADSDSGSAGLQARVKNGLMKEGFSPEVPRPKAPA